MPRGTAPACGRRCAATTTSGPTCSDRAVRRRGDLRRLAREARATPAGPLLLRHPRRRGAPLGLATLMEIRPDMRVIEVGHIVYSPALQRTPLAHRGAIPARALRLRDARLPPLRMEMQRAQRAVAARGAALRLHVRRHLPPAHDRQGPQPRHRLVLHARQRVAGAQGARSSAGSRRKISMRRDARRRGWAST